MITDRLRKYVVGTFFILFFLLGVLIYRDYGISWDEPSQRQIGYVSFNYVFKGEKTLLNFIDRDYGPFFELPLATIERFLHLKNIRTIYLSRHLFTFLFFYVSVIFFYFLAKKIFKNWKWAILSCFVLVVSPRIFSDSFYNSKDIPFMSLMIISSYTLFQLLEKKGRRYVFYHAAASAALTSTRILGVIMPALTIFFLLVELILNNNKAQMVFNILLYILLFILLTIIFWPFLWSNPIINFVYSFKNLARFRFEKNLSVLYLGNYISPYTLPWHYVPVWIFITTPFSYIVLFITGITRFFSELLSIKSIKKIYRLYIFDWIALLLFVLPILTIIVFRSVVYDGWRHLYFVYPFMVIFIIRGIMLIPKLFITLVVIEMATVIIFMIYYHPYQNLYFNFVFSNRMETVKKNFELDYWGLSYRKALEYIVKTDKSPIIPVVVANNPGDSNSLILPEKDRLRLKYLSVDDMKQAKYFLSNYRWHNGDYNYGKEVYSIKIGDAKIMVVQKLY